MSFENRYSLLDKTLHKIAFKTYSLQTALSDIENSIYRKRLADIKIDRPVFVTALPRAGTTLLLELCFTLDEFVSHTYRDMPFVVTPMLWRQFSRGFRKDDTPRERAHGDGMLVSVDSPEAFEEILWKPFWRDHYLKDRIVPWSGAGKREFTDFLCSHIRKLIASHGRTGVEGIRYISKNNLNIARLPLLRKLFPDARVVVPFREPLQHAASLLRQHMNFLKIQDQDSFAKEYMAAIGHYDFGENLKPVDFDHWLDNHRSVDAQTLEFWLQYWIAAYKNILNSRDKHVFLMSYESFCAEPQAGFEKFAAAVQIRDTDKFLRQTHRIKAAKPHAVDETGLDSSLLDEARELHGELCSASIP